MRLSSLKGFEEILAHFLKRSLQVRLSAGRMLGQSGFFDHTVGHLPPQVVFPARLTAGHMPAELGRRSVFDVHFRDSGGAPYTEVCRGTGFAAFGCPAMSLFQKFRRARGLIYPRILAEGAGDVFRRQRKERQSLNRNPKGRR